MLKLIVIIFVGIFSCYAIDIPVMHEAQPLVKSSIVITLIDKEIAIGGEVVLNRRKITFNANGDVSEIVNKIPNDKISMVNLTIDRKFDTELMCKNIQTLRNLGVDIFQLVLNGKNKNEGIVLNYAEKRKNDPNNLNLTLIATNQFVTIAGSGGFLPNYNFIREGKNKYLINIIDVSNNTKFYEVAHDRSGLPLVDDKNQFVESDLNNISKVKNIANQIVKWKKNGSVEWERLSVENAILKDLYAIRNGLDEREVKCFDGKKISLIMEAGFTYEEFIDIIDISYQAGFVEPLLYSFEGFSKKNGMSERKLKLKLKNIGNTKEEKGLKVY